jgi:hypothetical protein
MTASETHELVDVIDLQPIPGEYLHCSNSPKTPHEAFGVTVQAWFPYHAQRIAVGQRWGGKCECCGHRIRYAHITQDETGEYHCFGGTCVNVRSFGERAARKMEYSQRVKQKEDSGFCATFNVPSMFWDMPREKRPAYARPWKGMAMSRRGRGRNSIQWKLSVWGSSFEECLTNCIALDELLGVKLA